MCILQTRGTMEETVSARTVLREGKGGEALNSLQLPQIEDDGLMGPGGSPSSPKDNISISHEKP